jgi:Asp-tRNA(Asn)/Glu-tRNA(Gln) amidotransferase A subunit family amidase
MKARAIAPRMSAIENSNLANIQNQDCQQSRSLPQCSNMDFVKRLLFFCCLMVAAGAFGQTNTNGPIKLQTVGGAEDLIGLHFSEAKNELMLPGLREQISTYEVLRKFPLSNAIPSAMLFNPIPVGMKFDSTRKKFKISPAGKVKLPANMDDLAFYSISELGALIKSRQITSEKLTCFYIERLKKYGPRLECVITLTEDLAIHQARCADREIATGRYLGPLHGIPYAVKDLLTTRGIRTTWGSAPFKDQLIDEDATVVKRLEAAGAVLVAKLTMGELAWGEVWYGGMTRNPWNLKEGSSGSSAGPAAATSAGLIPFAIGSETHGSIVSPCDRCGITGLRPTYGRISRNGAMALTWSMDKLGPICRDVEDCAIVFNAIYGPDGVDQTLYDLPFNYDSKLKWQKLRIGYLKADFDNEKGERKERDSAVLEKMRSLGAKLVPLELPKLPIHDISFVISVEGAAAFGDLTESGRDDLMKRQGRSTWPNAFREARFVPAVEYIQATRIRYLLIQETARRLADFDLFIAPSLDGDSELLTNLTGHPCVVVPDGFTKAGSPTSICFIGNLFKEAEILSVAKAYQDSTDFHRKHPTLD